MYKTFENYNIKNARRKAMAPERVTPHEVTSLDILEGFQHTPSHLASSSAFGVSSSAPKSFSDPEVWGPGFWLTLHTGAHSFPEKPSVIAKENMKGFINGLPYILPCKKCSEHAKSFISESSLDDVVSSRDSLFTFFVELHNQVNLRNGKKTFSVYEAKQKYSGAIEGKITF